MRIALAANGKTDVALSVKEITWDKFCERLSVPKVGAKDGSYYVRGGELIELRRSDENLKVADICVLDGDSSFDPETGEIINGAPPLPDVVKAMEDIGISFFAHTTHSYHRDEETMLWVWKYRILIPVKMQNPDELDAVVSWFIEQLHARGVFITDVPENRRWSQPWYMPRVASKDDVAIFRSHKFDGNSMDVAGAVQWRKERDQRLAQEHLLPSAPPASQALPDGSSDTITAFNDAHDLHWVRSTLEGAGYKFCFTDKRGPGGEAYRYIRPNSSSGTPGVVVFKGSRGHWCVFSHHGAEDPLSSKVSDPFDLITTLRFNGNRKAAARELLPKQEQPSIAEQINARHLQGEPAASTVTGNTSFPHKLAEQTQAPSDKPKRIIPLVMAAELKDEPITWLIDQLIPAKGFAALYGKPGSYKSFVALYLAGMISTGRDAFGKPATQGDVVYVAGEGGAGLKRRWDALRTHYDLPKEARIAFVRAQLNFRSTLDDLAALVEAIKSKNLTPQLVIVDTLARAFAGGNENSSEDMGAFISIMGAFQEQLSTAVMIVHHAGKDEAKGQRGHSSLLGAVDTELEAIKISADESPERVGELTVKKQKDGEDGQVIPYRMEVMRLSEIDPDASSLVVQPITEDERKKAAPPPREVKLTQAMKDVLTAFHEAAGAGFARQVSNNAIHPSCRCVSEKILREYFMSVCGSPTEKTKARQFGRGTDDLISARLMAHRDGWYWLLQKDEQRQNGD